MTLRKHYHFDKRYRSVRGRFLINGKIVWRRVVSFEERKLGADGEPLPVAKRERTRLDRALRQEWEQINTELQKDGAVRKTAGQSIQSLFQK